MNHISFFIGVSAFLSLHCSSSVAFTDAEKAKLDPPLTAIISGQEMREDRLETSMRKDGTKEYSVIIRSDKPEEVKELGIQVTSVFGDVIVARVSVEELKKIVSLQSVRAVQTGSKNSLHNN